MKSTIFTATAAALAMLPSMSGATAYNFAMEYSGSSFFDGWTFLDHFDNLTNGDAVFVSQSVAQKSNIAFVNDAGNAIMQVDNSTTLSFGEKRNTLHITSADQFTVGSVWIADFLHVPYGCSTWPSFWSVAPDWPTGGEIDTFEGVNDVKNNQMTLHTEPGCVQSNATQTSTLVNSTDCDFEANGNQGCTTTDPNTSSYGEAFAVAGGGIYVTEFAASGISSRSSIPSSLSSDNVTSFDTGSLGIPVVNWPNTGCNIDNFFRPQNLVFDITLCGDLAGQTTVFSQTCTGDCYVDWVTGPPSNFDNAYFEVKSVKIFGSGTNPMSSVIKASAAPRRANLLGWAGLTSIGVSVILAAAMHAGIP
ncbi:concanavalin A-like lectin/glucanase domain-containing protein [Phellopilus nigrolimitatus]|nr:concanavalin A-like lectin/glucanase domain-containing protein [Phellopilus nigrolimitatus]